MHQKNHRNDTCNQNERLHYIDTARGFALLCLVAGHIVTGNSFLFNWIFSFHMPLFFFLAGMCAKKPSVRFFPYLKKRAQKRLLPYYIIVAAGLLICMLIPSCRRVILADGLSVQAKHILLLMSPINLYIGQVWFLASLFWAEIYFYLWYGLCGTRGILPQLSAAALFAVLARNLWRLQAFLPATPGRLPFHMDSAYMGAFCYILGFLARMYGIPERLLIPRKSHKEKRKTSSASADRRRIWLILLMLSVNLYFGPFLNGYVNMCDLVFGNIFYYLTAMITGIAAIVLMSLSLGKCSLPEWYGRHSLPLFASHTFLIYLVRHWVSVIYGVQYTMMVDVPGTVAAGMTGAVLILFLGVGMGYDWMAEKIKFVK